MTDQDNLPLSKSDLRRMKPVPHAKTIRRAMGLTQTQFCRKYGIPLGTLRDWEQGISRPDTTAASYLKIIALNPRLRTKKPKPGAR